MTCAELIAALSKEDPGRIVIMARDPEGNGYAPLESFWAGAWKGSDLAGPRGAEVGLERLTADDEAAGYSEEDVVKGKPAVILCPRY